MWEENDTEWTHFRQDLMARHRASARLLADFLQCVDKQHLQTTVLEVIDLQRYRIISRPEKVRVALYDRLHLPFVFVVGRN